MVTAYPVEWFFLYIGMLLVVYKKMLAAFIVHTALHGVFNLILFRQLQPVGEIPGVHRSGWIVFYMLLVAAALQQQRFQSFFAQFLRCPPAADTTAYHDGIVGILRGRLVVDHCLVRTSHK